MAKLQLRENETLIGEGTMALHVKRGLGYKQAQGKIYVTNQRVCFIQSMLNIQNVVFELPVSDVAGYESKRPAHALFFLTVCIHDRNNNEYPLTGFPVRKLMGWLEQAGIKRL